MSLAPGILNMKFVSVYTCSWSTGSYWDLFHFPQIHIQPPELHDSQHVCTWAHDKHLRNKMDADMRCKKYMTVSTATINLEAFSKILKFSELQLNTKLYDLLTSILIYVCIYVYTHIHISVCSICTYTNIYMYIICMCMYIYYIYTHAHI